MSTKTTYTICRSHEEVCAFLDQLIPAQVFSVTVSGGNFIIFYRP